MNTTFTYEPLRDGRYFRLIRIRPGTGPILDCQLSNEEIQQSHVCLSYRWRVDTEQVVIRLNGLEFKVYRNVYDFLSLARAKYCDMMFWIDAICINQNDLVEETQQVPLMGEIYKHASKVLVWLDGDIPKLKYAADLVRNKRMLFRKEAIFNADTEEVITLKAPSLKLSKPMIAATVWRLPLKISRWWLCSARLSNILRSFRAVLLNIPDQNALNYFLMHDYWQRAWVVQELILNDKVDILIGNTHLSLAMLQDWCASVSGVRYKIKNTVYQGAVKAQWPLKKYMSDTDSWRQKHDPGDNLDARRPLVYVMNLIRTRRCLDFHDEIYALLALASDADRIEVDYSYTRAQFIVSVLPVVLSTMSDYTLSPHDECLSKTFLHVAGTLTGWLELRKAFLDSMLVLGDVCSQEAHMHGWTNYMFDVEGGATLMTISTCRTQYRFISRRTDLEDVSEISVMKALVQHKIDLGHSTFYFVKQSDEEWHCSRLSFSADGAIDYERPPWNRRCRRIMINFDDERPSGIVAM